VIIPFLEQAKRVQGVAHFLFHQFHIHNQPKVTDALRKVARTAREYGFTFMTCKQINDWERLRRTIRIIGLNARNQVELACDSIVDGREQEAVVWIPVLENEGSHIPDHTEIKFGVPCRKQKVALVPEMCTG
jgi:hypothetical protein